MTFGKLVAIELTSGMTEEGEGVVTITAVSDDGRIFSGQLEPRLVRGLGQTCFIVAESAQSDAIVFTMLQRDMLVDLTGALSFISKLRDMREDAA